MWIIIYTWWYSHMPERCHTYLWKHGVLTNNLWSVAFARLCYTYIWKAQLKQQGAQTHHHHILIYCIKIFINSLPQVGVCHAPLACWELFSFIGNWGWCSQSGWRWVHATGTDSVLYSLFLWVVRVCRMK